MTQSGLKQIYANLRPALIRYVLARGQSPEDAEDLMQDLYLKLDAHDGRRVDEPRAYLYRMTHNLLLDRRRSVARRAKREMDWSTGATGVVSEIDERPSAEEQLIARQQLEAITMALQTLPDRTQDIFRRFRIEGQTQKAIAANIGLSKSAVEKHIYRAYRVLAEARATFDAESPDTTSPTPERHIDMSDGDDS